jgi:cytochrome c
MQLLSTFKVLLSTFAMGLLMAGAVQAADQGTAAEAEAMTKRAVAYLKANGPEKAVEEFTNGKSFKDRDMYISYYDLSGKVLGHGANAKLVGKDLTMLKDPDGKLFIQMLCDLAKTKGKGWSESYKFRNPTTEKIAEKVMYLERVGDSWVGVGVYK